MKNLADGQIPGIRPDGYDKHGPFYTVGKLREIVLQDTSAGILIPAKEKKMSEQINKSADLIYEAKEKFNKVFASLLSAEQSASEAAKKASGNIRKAADDLASGLIKVQKTADFANLERQVFILERAATALTTLADLDKNGRLEKLIKALK